MKHLTYSGILRQRLVVAGLTLGLIAIMVGVGIDIYINNTQSAIPRSTRALIEPLDPQLDIDTVERLESYETVTVERAKSSVRQFIAEQQSEAAAQEAAIQESLEGLGLTPTESAAEAATPASELTLPQDPISPFLETPGEPVPAPVDTQ